MLRQTQEVANRYQTAPSTAAPYDMAIVVGTAANYVTTPEEFHPYALQGNAHKWERLVHIQTTQSMGQTGWTTWTLTTNRVSTRLSVAKAAADPFLSPIEVTALRHHQATTEVLLASRPDRLSVVMDFIGSSVTPRQANAFVRAIQGQEP